MKGDAAWAFAQTFYGLPGMMDGLIRLQDEGGVDISFLLLLLHAAERNLMLGVQEIEKLRLSADAWNQEIIAPLRRARRAVGPASRHRDDGLYARIKQVELQAEETVIRKLADMFPEEGVAMRQEAATANLRAYGESLGLSGGVFDAILTTFAGTTKQGAMGSPAQVFQRRQDGTQ